MLKPIPLSSLRIVYFVSYLNKWFSSRLFKFNYLNVIIDFLYLTLQCKAFGNSNCESHDGNCLEYEVEIHFTSKGSTWEFLYPSNLVPNVYYNWVKQKDYPKRISYFETPQFILQEYNNGIKGVKTCQRDQLIGTIPCSGKDG